MLTASNENELGLDSCKADTDGDGVPDGYEYWSARDLNDDEYQEPNTYLPYPGKRPYPNPLFKDADARLRRRQPVPARRSFASGTATAPSRPAACSSTATACTTPTASSTR